MKPITFESIRNLLKTKRKNKNDGGDTSFKRCDSFKRISIRRSYLDRGRKRALLRSSNLASSNSANNHSKQLASAIQDAHKQQPLSVSDIKVKSGEIYISRFNGKDIEVGVNERAIDAKVEKNLFKNKSLQEVNELCNENIIVHRAKNDILIYDNFGSGDDIDDDEPPKYERYQRDESSTTDESGQSKEVVLSTGCFVKAGSKLKKPIGTVLDVKTEETLNKNRHAQSSSQLHKANRSSIYQQSRAPLQSESRYTNRSDKNDFLRASLIEQRFDNQRPMSSLHLNKMDKPENVQYKNQHTSHTTINNLNQSIDPYLNENVKLDKGAKSRVFSSSTTAIENLNANERKSAAVPLVTHTSSLLDLQPKFTTVENHYSKDIPSMVIFKTYCNEPNKNTGQYLETNFENTNDSMQKNNIKGNSNNRRFQFASSSKDNVTRTSVNHDRASHLTRIDSQTFKLPSKKKGEGIVIRISDQSTHNISADRSNTETPDSRDSLTEENDYANDETSLNGKFTFEIYKELQRTKRQEFGTGFTDNSNLTLNTTNSDEIGLKSFDSHKVQNSSDKSNNKNPESIAVNETFNDLFQSMHIDESIDKNFYLEPDPYDHYDDVNVISPDSSIPYPMRIKTNPFTREKEPYSVNLGRVWKQLNLGQDEQSLDTTNAVQQSQANLKTKNESFKSMSSHDSGFSLTLTKKYDRTIPKKPRRKSKITLYRDGQLKKAMAMPQNSINRRKKRIKSTADNTDANQQQQQQQHMATYVSVQPNNNGTFNKNETFGTKYSKKVQIKRKLAKRIEHDASFSQEISDLEAFFEEHLKRLKEYYLHKKKINEQTINELYQDYESNNDDDDDVDDGSVDGLAQQLSKVKATVHQKPYKLKTMPTTNVDVTQELMNRADNEHHIDLNDEKNIEKNFLLLKDNQMQRASAGKLSSHRFTKHHQQQQHKRHCQPTLLSECSHQNNGSTNTNQLFDSLDFVFPHPDKRITMNNDKKKKTKFQTKEVRDFSQDYSDENASLQYATLDFSNNFNGVGSGGRVNADNKHEMHQEAEYLAFPYGKIKYHMDSDQRIKYKNTNNKNASTTNFSLSTLFPSVHTECTKSTSIAATNNSDKNSKYCCDAYKFTANEYDAAEIEHEHAYHKKNTNDEQEIFDGDDDEFEDISSDDEVDDNFSESEFITNSMGNELKLVYDKFDSSSRRANNNDLPPKTAVRRHNRKLCYFDCVSDVNTPIEISKNFQNENRMNKSGKSTAKQRKIKRIKSRRASKNHSLRRDYWYYTSKY